MASHIARHAAYVMISRSKHTRSRTGFHNHLDLMEFIRRIYSTSTFTSPSLQPLLLPQPRPQWQTPSSDSRDHAADLAGADLYPKQVRSDTPPDSSTWLNQTSKCRKFEGQLSYEVDLASDWCGGGPERVRLCGEMGVCVSVCPLCKAVW